jgi:hypothetical protein
MIVSFYRQIDDQILIICSRKTRLRIRGLKCKTQQNRMTNIKFREKLLFDPFISLSYFAIPLVFGI